MQARSGCWLLKNQSDESIQCELLSVRPLCQSAKSVDNRAPTQHTHTIRHMYIHTVSTYLQDTNIAHSEGWKLALFWHSKKRNKIYSRYQTNTKHPHSVEAEFCIACTSLLLLALSLFFCETRSGQSKLNALAYGCCG